MPFWETREPQGSFVSHFTMQPERDFGLYGKGYAKAARSLSKELLSRGFADYEAYPIVFLYRHALELHLKNVIIKGLHLVRMRGEKVLERVTYDHNLARLSNSATKVLRAAFPADSIDEFLQRLDDVVRDFIQL